MRLDGNLSPVTLSKGGPTLWVEGSRDPVSLGKNTVYICYIYLYIYMGPLKCLSCAPRHKKADGEVVALGI